MNVSLAMRGGGVVAATALALAACGSNGSGTAGNTSPAADSSTCGNGSLTPQGSTFQQTLEQQWASSFHNKCSTAQVTYSGTGSSAGIQQFTTGKVEFAGSDVTMTSEQQAQADQACGSTALTLPITAGGIAVMYNLPGVTGLQLSAPTVAGIFMGKITKWDDPQIASDNPKLHLPSTPISTFHRADGSGTTAVLSGFLSAVAPQVWKLGSNTTLTWPSGQGATGSSGVAQGVKSTNGGITYAEVTYAKQDGLSVAAIKGAHGGYVTISAASVSKSINSGFVVTGSGSDLAGKLDFGKMTGYPLSTVSYVLVCSTYQSAGTGTLVRNYLAYAAGTGQTQANALGYAPLPNALASRVQTAVAGIK